MATITTVSPTVSSRDQIAPATDDETVADVLDLGQVEGWSFLASFAFPEPSLAFTYSASNVELDIGAGRVARFANDQQTILTLAATSGIGLKGETVNYIYFRADDTIEVRDQDTPPGSDALLIGTVNTDTGTVRTDTRGRSPVSEFIAGTDDTVDDGSGDSTIESPAGRTVVETDSLSDTNTKHHRESITDGQVLRLYVAGVMDDSLTTTTGLSAQVVDESDGTVYHTTENKRTSAAPLAEIYGPADLRFEINNASGGAVTTPTGRWVYSVVKGDPPGLAVDTVESTNITNDSADLTGDLRSLGKSSSADVSHEYREVGGTFTQTATDTVSSPQQFTDSISGLNSGTDYEFRSLAAGSNGSTDEGAILTLTTTSGVQVSTVEATNTTADSADLTGDLTDLDTASSADVSHEYREVGGTFTQTATDTVSSPQQFTDSISGLNSGTDYEFRSLAAGSNGSTDEGALLTFATDAAISPIYAIGGNDTFGVVDKNEEYDGSSWTTEDPMSKAREGLGVVADGNGNIYALGGVDDNDNILSNAEKWDGSSWSSISNMPTEREDPGAAADASGNVYAIGGLASYTTFLASVDKWDGSSWSSIPDMPTKRYVLAATGDSNGNLYALGGFDSNFDPIATAEKWDGSSWTSLPDMPAKRGSLAAATDSNDNIYAIGGSDPNSDATATVFKWDGSSWSSITNMPTKRISLTAATAGNGDIYVLGGNNASTNGLSTVEKWDGSSWSSVSNMPTGRYSFGAAKI